MIPVRLGECEMPRRLSHLQWLTAPNDPSAVADIYSRLQASLLARAEQLGLVTHDQLQSMPSRPILGVKGVQSTPLQGGRYLVRGQNPDGSKYYGVAQVRISCQNWELSNSDLESCVKYEMTWYIGGREIKYEGEWCPPHIARKRYRDYVLSHDDYPPEPEYDSVSLRGDYEVTYTGQSWTGIYKATWGSGGIEELIPASPLVRGRTA